MFQSEEGVRKLGEFIKKKFPEMCGGEIEKMARNLYDLGAFLVHLKIKQHSKSTNDA